MKNRSAVSEFILVGLSRNPELQGLVFWLFITIYAVALTFNLLLVVTISTCRKLHTPMYFLLVNLSLVNLFCISIMTPKMLQMQLVHHKAITFRGCIAQVYLFIWALGTEIVLLSFMAFDRYAAICHPLRYTVIMRKEVCVAISVGVWVGGMANSAVHTGLVLQLSFCDSNIVNHFFCNLPPLLMLSCSDTSLNETMVFVSDVLIAIGSCALTLTSYGFILRTIIRIRSTEGKKKAFSTCSSHLLVVTFYFSTIIYTFTRPASIYSLDEDKMISLLYSVVPPVVNPIVYSLRNREVKEGLKQLVRRNMLFQRFLS
ncbi:olfactory receptor 13G1-like [Tiliqua scincoides]|uniref:olfactory receptor 13G1-like n=1 Tax=Tiliqua scincoides TaxID=71010 RepID=UPI003462559C